jgi:hypothetical protein
MARAFEATGHFKLFTLTDPPPQRTCYWIEHKYPRAGSEEGLTLLAECTQCIGEDGRAFTTFLPGPGAAAPP